MRKALLMVMVFALALSMMQVYNVKAEETLIWSGNVYSSGGTTTGPVLDAFIQYRVVAKGVFFSVVHLGWPQTHNTTPPTPYTIGTGTTTFQHQMVTRSYRLMERT